MSLDQMSFGLTLVLTLVGIGIAIGMRRQRDSTDEKVVDRLNKDIVGIEARMSEATAALDRKLDEQRRWHHDALEKAGTSWSVLVQGYVTRAEFVMLQDQVRALRTNGNPRP